MPQTDVVISSVKGSDAQFVKGNSSMLQPVGAQEIVSVGSRHSADSVSNNSAGGWSVSSFDTANEAETLAQPASGFDYRSHFSLFSRYTSQLALEYCPPLGGDIETCSVPPVWCLDYRNGIVAVGCGNGQIEVKSWLSSLFYVANYIIAPFVFDSY